MKLGAILPQTEIRGDPAASVRTFVAAIEDAGYDHLLVYDHVLGADPARHEGWSGYYDVDDPFLEPLTLFGYLAAISELELVTLVLVLPQRQAVLVAKQVATLDVLSGGRIRLGVGLGWNGVEYEALGQDFSSRARRLEEQIEVMRALWTTASVRFDGRDHVIDGAGINPRSGRSIPVWIGTSPQPPESALRRIGRVADGWISGLWPGRGLEAGLEVVAEAARAAGRDPAAIGLEGNLSAPGMTDGTLRDRARRWRSAGASHLAVSANEADLPWPHGHIDVLASAADTLRDLS